jgi:TolB protein
MNREGVNLSQLTHMQKELHYPSWSSDYKKFVCATNEKNILIIAAGKIQEKLENIPSNCNHSSWSPDGNKIAFASNRSGNMDIWVVDPDGKNAKQLTFKSPDVNYPGKDAFNLSKRMPAIFSVTGVTSVSSRVFSDER